VDKSASKPLVQYVQSDPECVHPVAALLLHRDHDCNDEHALERWRMNQNSHLTNWVGEIEDEAV
jgi:hypothetical protein